MTTQDLARIVPWPKTALRCQIHTCRNTAAYMIRHKQAMFADKQFLICADCAVSILRNLPPELAAVLAKAPADHNLTTPDEVINQFEKSCREAIQGAPVASPPLVQCGEPCLKDGVCPVPVEEGPCPKRIEVTSVVHNGHTVVTPKLTTIFGAAVVALPEAEIRKRYPEGEGSVMEVTLPDGKMVSTPVELPATANKPYNADLCCPTCGKGPFKNVAALKGHMNGKHGGKKK